MENANVNTFLTLRKFMESNSLRIGEVVKSFKRSHISFLKFRFVNYTYFSSAEV